MLHLYVPTTYTDDTLSENSSTSWQMVILIMHLAKKAQETKQNVHRKPKWLD